MSGVWGADGANDGMRYPEVSDLVGGETDTPAIEMATVLRCAAYTAYTLTLNGHAPYGAFEWFKKVDIGQLVIETSTMFSRDRDRYGVGWLVKKTSEPLPGDFGDEEPPLETCWYIECLDGVVYRWTNADFVRVPETATPWREKATAK